MFAGSGTVDGGSEIASSGAVAGADVGVIDCCDHAELQKSIIAATMIDSIGFMNESLQEPGCYNCCDGIDTSAGVAMIITKEPTMGRFSVEVELASEED